MSGIGPRQSAHERERAKKQFRQEQKRLYANQKVPPHPDS